VSNEKLDKIILSRDSNGEAIVNIPQLVLHHSPSGFDFGRNGSGPAELALNILEYVLRQQGYTGATEKTMRGTHCFRLAYRLHQRFKEIVIMTAPNEGGAISVTVIEEWLEQQREAISADDLKYIDGTLEDREDDEDA